VKILVVKILGVIYCVYVRKIVMGSCGEIACNKDSNIVNSFTGCLGSVKYPRLFSGLPTDPTNQHESFQRVFSSLACLLGNFPVGHPSQNFFKLSTLNCGVLME